MTPITMNELVSLRLKLSEQSNRALNILVLVYLSRRLQIQVKTLDPLSPVITKISMKRKSFRRLKNSTTDATSTQGPCLDSAFTNGSVILHDHVEH